MPMYTLNCKGKLLLLDKPLLMGIINVTPDSFYEGHLDKELNEIVALADKMLTDGADILDIGGKSTKPGSKRITANEELERILPIIKAIHQKNPDTIISIDTFYSSVANAAINTGASIVNDISAGSLDDKMIPTVASLKVPYICMHMQGTPDIMQKDPHYDD